MANLRDCLPKNPLKKVEAPFFLVVKWWNLATNKKTLRWIGEHAHEDLAKFGYRSKRQVEFIWSLATYWQHAWTYGPNNVNSTFFFSSKHDGVRVFSPKNPLYKSQHIFFLPPPKKKPWSQLKMIFQTQAFSSLFCACHIWPSAHPTFSNSQLTRQWYKRFKRAVTSLLCKFKAISSSMKTSNIVATCVTLWNLFQCGGMFCKGF